MADSNLSLQKKQKKNKSAYGNQPPGTVTLVASRTNRTKLTVRAKKATATGWHAAILHVFLDIPRRRLMSGCKQSTANAVTAFFASQKTFYRREKIDRSWEKCRVTLKSFSCLSNHQTISMPSNVRHQSTHNADTWQDNNNRDLQDSNFRTRLFAIRNWAKRYGCLCTNGSNWSRLMRKIPYHTVFFFSNRSNNSQEILIIDRLIENEEYDTWLQQRPETRVH